MMRVFKLTFLALLLLSPSISRADDYQDFLIRFQKLYETYHFGKHLSQSEVTKIASRMWAGSGKSYHFASTIACQAIMESHLEIVSQHLRYRGHCGMHLGTIVVEAIRIKMIKNTKAEKMALLKRCEHDPSLADYLAASRLVYLSRVYKSKEVAIKQWVTGEAWRHKKKEAIRAEKYYNNTENLRRKMFDRQNWMQRLMKF